MSRLCRLKTAKHGDDGKWAYEEITKLREQVAAQAAVIELYEQALIASWPEGAMGDAFDYWNKARAATNSTQILDEVRRAERERCAKVCKEIYTNGDGAEGWLEIAANRIRAME